MRRSLCLAAAMVATAGVTGSIAAGPPLKPQVAVKEPFQDAAFQSLCHLTINRRKGLFTPSYTGSAVLWRGRYLLTAGHNVYQDRSKIRSVEIRCGAADAEAAPVDETIEAWQALDASGFNAGPFIRDFGVIRLNRPIEVARPFALASDPARPGEAIRFAGYPGGPHSGKKLFEARGARVTEVADGLAYYDIETFKSNSGGPVWREVDGKPELIAIHVTESGGRMVDEVYLAEVGRLVAELDRRAAERGR